MPDQGRFENLSFPTAGVDLSQAFWTQRQGTTRQGENVRAFDRRGRARGGSRPGNERWLDARPDGANPIQELNVVVRVTEAALLDNARFWEPDNDEWEPDLELLYQPFVAPPSNAPPDPREVEVVIDPATGREVKAGGTGSAFGSGLLQSHVVWADPADILTGTALSGTQLNATATGSDELAGTFTYYAPTGTILEGPRIHTLGVVFTPDSPLYLPSSGKVEIGVGMFRSGSGSFACAGQNATMSYQGPSLQAGHGAFALTGQSATMTYAQVLQAANGSFALTGQNATMTYTPPASDVVLSGTGNWVATLTATITVKVFAGGGGGAAYDVNGGGGGGGGQSTVGTYAVTDTVSYAYSVGAGGAGGVLFGAAAANGVNTSFGNASPLVAFGGTAGSGGNGGAGGTGGGGGTPYAGGAGGSNSGTSGGGGGSSAGTAAAGANGSTPGAGGTAPTGGGNGGAGGTVGNNGTAGSAPGGGGGGNGNLGNGGAGAAGTIILTL